MLSLEEIFPPFALRVACGPVELRVLRDDDVPELVELVRGGVTDPALPMPFLQAWHEEPFTPGAPDGFPTSSLRWWWTQRATCSPEEWRLALTVRRDGVLVGMQDLHAVAFPQRRSVLTGSWLGRAHHGVGTGTLMRRLAVVLALDELGAAQCESGYIVGNHASAAVSRKVGYRENGRHRVVQRSAAGAVGADEQRVVVTRDTVVRPGEPVTVEGAAVLRRFLGVDDLPHAAASVDSHTDGHDVSDVSDDAG
ncbi:RimJ/RimL family protein N-acetyltransferase [Terracoccus luteus]|uniref:RimJ/RimL family protein N-acetyltransferase n=1 Tax=Terracoccus luteus TaxID=53356 RepID=A0A495Y3W7_9MICO|nr:GNAT family protein [Terracoccus luteus]RKT80066.1 RimJ/RimL family protein N-acetyltransferase [Terracoccus luteus]